MKPVQLVVVTGLSGSGKSTAIHVLEDLGFYCIDNLPVALIPRLVELWETSGGQELRRVALGIDVRERRFLAEFPRVCAELRAAGVALEVLYLEANDDVLVRRFSETRRPHPTADGGSIADGIQREREKLQRSLGGIKDLASLPDAMFVIDVGYQKGAIAEARKLSIPVVGVVDTNHSPEGIDYVIPGNDDSSRAIRLYARGMADAVLEGRNQAVEEIVSASRDEFVEVNEEGHGG